MFVSSARPTGDIEEAVRSYGNSLYRLCYVMLNNEKDAEDAVQDTFIKYIEKSPSFADSEHEKAWLITVAQNRCRDILRQRKRYSQTDIEVVQEYAESTEDSSVMDALMTLPEKFRLVLTLYYIEEYRVEDIAKIIGKTPSAVKMRLQKGRHLLKEAYGKESL